jgi:alpha-beta hydrolase superfamily lysophospholipase
MSGAPASLPSAQRMRAPLRLGLRAGIRRPARALGAAVALIALLASACAPRLHPPGSDEVAARLFDDRVRTTDGATLPLRRWLPEGEPRAVILALHGFNDYANAFTEPAAFWGERGIGTYAYDQRGFGETAHRGLWPGTEALAQDLRTVARLIKSRHRDVPLYVLGESMGGAVALVALADDDRPAVDGVVLAAPAVWARRTMNPLQRGLLWLAAHTLPWLTVTGRGLRIRASDNVEMLRALAKDPLVIKEARIDTLYGLANLMDAALDAALRLRVPALILYGEHDQVIPRRPTSEMLSRLPPGDTAPWRVALYRRGFHMLLRDLQAEAVRGDIAAWIENPNAPLPSGADRHAALMLAPE